MIELELQPVDYPSIRFCTSPVGEAVLSLRILQDPSRHALYFDWIHQAAAAVDPATLSELFRLVRASGYIPDFLTPAPDGLAGEADFDAEMLRIRRTPPSVVRRDVDTLIKDGAAVEELSPFLDDPSEGLESYCDALRGYWDTTLAPHWSRIASVLRGDIVHRAHVLAVQGPGALFRSIHPAMGFDEQSQCVRVRKRIYRSFSTAGTGLRLVPRIFSWPDIYVTAEPLPISIAYPPRGLALWGQVLERTERAIEAAFGAGRARILLELITPVHVTELAVRLGVTKSAVSQHLSRLSKAGLVEMIRHRGYRYHHLSQRGETIVRAFDVSLPDEVGS